MHQKGCAERILLSDTDLHVNAVAYLAQHLIVLLDPADIVINLHHAYRRREFRDRHYSGAVRWRPPTSKEFSSTALKACVRYLSCRLRGQSAFQLEFCCQKWHPIIIVTRGVGEARCSIQKYLLSFC